MKCPSCGWDEVHEPREATPLEIKLGMAAPISESVEWRPIETAPKNRTKFLGAWQNRSGDYISDHMVIMWWEPDYSGREGFFDGNINGYRPTHWMPLPPPPGVEKPYPRHARDCLYVTSDGPASCTCDYAIPTAPASESGEDDLEDWVRSNCPKELLPAVNNLFAKPTAPIAAGEECKRWDDHDGDGDPWCTTHNRRWGKCSPADPPIEKLIEEMDRAENQLRLKFPGQVPDAVAALINGRAALQRLAAEKERLWKAKAEVLDERDEARAALERLIGALEKIEKGSTAYVNSWQRDVALQALRRQNGE